MDNQYFCEPYSDNNLKYDEESGRYIITEDGLTSKGIYLRSRIDRYGGEYADTIISSFCEVVSTHVYNYIMNFATNPEHLEYAIAHNKKLRRVIYNAQAEQAKYVFFNGDTTLSNKAEERQNYMGKIAADILSNAGLTYSGGF